jgi:hypothetical protein
MRIIKLPEVIPYTCKRGSERFVCVHLKQSSRKADALDVSMRGNSRFMPNCSEHKFLFVAGLHKSGTTVLTDALKEHPDISGFCATGFPKDEGQFLQDVFPSASEFGGPGEFGFHDEMHLTEESPLLTSQNKDRIFAQWGRHWNLSKSVLLEKSPPNILKTRFLQELFPRTFFVLIMRHPVATSCATMKWIKADPILLLRHWIRCHELFTQDRKHLKNVVVFKYEDFVKNPDIFLNKILDLLHVPYAERTVEVQAQLNKKYFLKWQKILEENNWPKDRSLAATFQSIEREINAFGYSMYSEEPIH